ncbi:hypothetical protein AAF712_005041 [Marasmius tenuissimus]|uniref:PX domain-containing protein n=1 Tax=Marasmius tenuissimus TaxID=585030 RepID=A0ABR3A2K2_9AGAR|nr:hypothetical protein PM082_016421 [Marasmius tenuissimus]
MHATTVASVGELPFSPDDFKRAILRPPPKKFSVMMLAPTKKGGHFLYGLRVNPLNYGDRSSIGSGGSGGSSARAFTDPYEIWRKWEDCLYFQDQIEEEYGRLARIKRQRLIKGKGVKKNGMYKQDAASSWESLPPGPDPNSVAQDVHNLVPRLSQKGGSLFGNKQAIIDLRLAELAAFMTALFKDDVPALLEEVRSERIVTDFFGYWQRDQDLLQKSQARLKKNRQSTASSILSFYAGPQDDSDARSFTSVTTDTSISPSRSSFSSRISSLSPRKRRPRPLSTSSDSSSGSGPSSTGSITSTTPSIAEDVPIIFNHNPRVRSQSDLQPPPADIPSTLPENLYVRRVKKRSSRETLYRRSARIFSTPPNFHVPSEDGDSLAPPETPRITRRDSVQTIDSARTYLEGLDMAMPSSPTQIYHSSRLSIGSIATIMTTCSADAVIPSEPPMRTSRIPGNRRSRPVSILSVDGSWSDGDEEALDSGLFDEFPMPAHLFPHRVDISEYPIEELCEEEERSETPCPGRRSHSPPDSYSSDSEETVDEPSTPTVPDMYVTTPVSPSTCSTFSDAPSTIRGTERPMSALSITSDATAHSDITTTSDTSFTSVLSSTTVATTTSDTSTLSPTTASENYTIKAAHNQSIILLRVPKSTPFHVLRTKIHEKFANQEKVTLSDSFTLAFVIPDVVVSKGDTPGKAKRRTRERSSSMSSAGGPVQMALVTSQDQWEKVTRSTELSKITLRVLDTVVL